MEECVQKTRGDGCEQRKQRKKATAGSRARLTGACARVFSKKPPVSPGSRCRRGPCGRSPRRTPRTAPQWYFLKDDQLVFRGSLGGGVQLRLGLWHQVNRIDRFESIESGVPVATLASVMLPKTDRQTGRQGSPMGLGGDEG